MVKPDKKTKKLIVDFLNYGQDVYGHGRDILSIRRYLGGRFYFYIYNEFYLYLSTSTNLVYTSNTSNPERDDYILFSTKEDLKRTLRILLDEDEVW